MISDSTLKISLSFGIKYSGGAQYVDSAYARELIIDCHFGVIFSSRPSRFSFRTPIFQLHHTIFLTYGIFLISQAMPKQAGRQMIAAKPNFISVAICKLDNARVRKTRTGTWMVYTVKECCERNRPNFFPPSRKRRKKVINAKLIPTAKIESHRAN